MSKVKIEGNASGTGTLTIAAPNTNTDLTLTLPTEGSLVTADASGNVGIGTSSPSAPLTVNHSTQAGIRCESGGTLMGGFQANTSDAVLYAYGSNPIRFAQSNGGTDRMRIDSSGRVTMPYQPSMFIAGSGSYTPLVTQNGVSGTVPFSYLKSGNGTGFNATTNTFTAPVGGNYLVSVYGLQQNTSDNELRILINGSYVTRCYTVSERGGYGHTVVLSLQENDYLQITSNNSLYMDSTSTYTGLSITLLS